VKATAAAHPNLALVKYWGKADETLNIPANSSISVNLSGATTVTSVAFSPQLAEDVVLLDGQLPTPRAGERVVRCLDRVRQLAGIAARARVESHNDFPAVAGIASSASAFAALSLAASRAAGLTLNERELSILARKGSGSACRSIPDGFAEWVAGDSDDSSFARQIAPPGHWDLRITTVVLDEGAKEIASSDGHRAAVTSPFYRPRLETLPQTLETVRRALLERDLGALGVAVERDAISMHAIAMTSYPAGMDWLSGIYYWLPGTLALIRAVQEWRRQGLPVYLTIDAGPNVHLIGESGQQGALEGELAQFLAQVGGRYFVSEPASGAWVISSD
jgi:diphosphomevalonate decarboxylase